MVQLGSIPFQKQTMLLFYQGEAFMLKLIVILSLSLIANAKDNDPFACNEELSKAEGHYKQIQAMSEKYIDEQLDIAAQKSASISASLGLGSSCDFSELAKNIHKRLKQDSDFSLSAKMQARDSEFSKYVCRVRPEASVFQPVGKMAVKGSMSSLTEDLSPNILLCKQKIGADKLDQFFDQGHRYYLDMNKNGLRYATTQANLAEYGEEGIKNSFIKSNADIYTSFQGAMFYQNLSKYFVCHEGKFYRKKENNITVNFNLCDYVDSAWSESENCNTYASIKQGTDLDFDHPLAGFVHINVRDKYKKASCPQSEDACYDAMEKTRVAYLDIPDSIDKHNISTKELQDIFFDQMCINKAAAKIQENMRGKSNTKRKPKTSR